MIARRWTARRWTARRGVTLIELVVVLVILGIITTVVGVTIHTARTDGAQHNELETQLSTLRQQAITSGVAVTKVIHVDSLTGTATAFPDGRVLSTFGDIDPMTGRARAR